jgi:hypothetical protein
MGGIVVQILLRLHLDDQEKWMGKISARTFAELVKANLVGRSIGFNAARG